MITARTYLTRLFNGCSKVRIQSSFLIIAGLALLFTLTLGCAAKSYDTAQAPSEPLDLNGAYEIRIPEQGFRLTQSHLEFSLKGNRLLATAVYDDRDMARDYGERHNFFEASLRGRAFSGVMKEFGRRAGEEGLTIKGTISGDNKLVTWYVLKNGQEIRYRAYRLE
jgi:hypothetical protein